MEEGGDGECQVMAAGVGVCSRTMPKGASWEWTGNDDPSTLCLLLLQSEEEPAVGEQDRLRLGSAVVGNNLLGQNGR